MNIILNGTSHRLESPMTLDRFLESIGFAGKPVVIELDEQAVFPRDYALTEIREGSKIELVTLAAGG